MILRRKDILIQLPPETDQLTRNSGGISTSTLYSQSYNPVYGTIINKSDSCEKAQIGDKVFFQVFTFSVAKERAYGMDNPEDNAYRPNPSFAYKEDGKWYMILPETEIYFSMRGSDIELWNEYTIAKPLYNQTVTEESGIALVNMREWQKDAAQVVSTSAKYLKSGDIINTLRYCEITIEEKLNCPILPETWFIIENKNITSIAMDNNFKASPNRLIVKVITPENDSSGIVNTELDKQKLLNGLVTSAGEGTNFNEGEKVMYARFSGMPIPGTDLIVLEDKDIFAVVN